METRNEILDYVSTALFEISREAEREQRQQAQRDAGSAIPEQYMSFAWHDNGEMTKAFLDGAAELATQYPAEHTGAIMNWAHSIMRNAYNVALISNLP